MFDRQQHHHTAAAGPAPPLVLLLVVLSVLLAVSCARLEPQVLTTRPAQAGQLSDEAVHASNRFGLSLYQELLAVEGEANRFISPYSITLALSMTLAGAQGETAEQMAAALQLDGLDRQTVSESHAALTHRLLRDDAGVQLAIASSLWGQLGAEFRPEFIETNRDYYAAGLEQLDFGRPEALEIINSWVEEHTGGHIDEMFSELPANLVLLLLNAIYFQGDWMLPFDEDLTTDAPFHNLDGTTVQVPMMTQVGEFAHLETEDVHAVRLPYGDGGDLAMYVFLPSAKLGPGGFHENLGYDQLQGWLAGFQDGQIQVSLPRFELEYEAELDGALEALGMELAFTPAADFTGIMEDGGIWIDEVKHKSFVAVDEKGTEAAAATSVAIIRSAPSFTMTVDRPFFFMIHDSETDAVLFMGSVVDLST